MKLTSYKAALEIGKEAINLLSRRKTQYQKILDEMFPEDK